MRVLIKVGILVCAAAFLVACHHGSSSKVGSTPDFYIDHHPIR